MNDGFVPESVKGAAVAGADTTVHSKDVASSDELASSVTGWPAIGRDGVEVTRRRRVRRGEGAARDQRDGDRATLAWR